MSGVRSYPLMSIQKEKSIEKSYSFMLHTNIPIKPKARGNCGSQWDLGKIERFTCDFFVKSQFGWFNRF